MSQHSNARPNRPTRGFTLVELMVVIVIIGILIGVLIPSVGAVRRMAREASTKATFTAIETGLEMFKGDQKFGGEYPPSSSDYETSTDNRRVVSPYEDGGRMINVSGAGFLVWALSGADLLGCPGFKPMPNFTTWGQSSGNAVGMAYHINTGVAVTGIGPAEPRAAQYVDSGRVRLSEPTATKGKYVIPAEAKALGSDDDARRDYRMYLDAFGYPVLYWRADPTGRLPAERGYNARTNYRGVYHWLDNGHLIGGFAGAPVLTLTKGGGKHLLEWENGPDFTDRPAGPSLPGSYQRTFQGYIVNLDVQSKWTEHNPKSYMLVSPGYDGVYGTADDIANFKHNGMQPQE